MEFNSRRSDVRARNGMIGTTQPLASAAGLRMMMEGGNAIDAAVAAAAVQNVVEPMSTGIGGDVFALVWMDGEKKVVALNASGRSASAASIDELTSKGLTEIPEQSAYAVSVPGCVSGWQTILDQYGTMPLSKVLEPAISYARNGFPVSEVIAKNWSVAGARLGIGPAGGELLLNGSAPKVGDIMKMPELAESLQQVADGGADAFYSGPIADKIEKYVQGQGGWLSAKDLANHEADWVEPVSTTYRDATVWQVPPNSQGVNVLMALNLAEGYDLGAMGYQSVDTYHHLIESMRLAFADGLYHITDPRFSRVPVKELLSKVYADERRKLIDSKRTMDVAPVGPIPKHSDTVYISAMDGQGNGCSFINSIFAGFGSGHVVPGTGIVLHNRGRSFELDAEHPNALAPNKRPYHTLIPGMVTRNDDLWLSYGVMGAMQQAQGHLQVLVNMIDYGMTPQQALDAPRFSVRLGEHIAIETLVPDSTVSALGARGHDMVVGDPASGLFGAGQIIERDPDTGALTGGSEPRQDGAALGF